MAKVPAIAQFFTGLHTEYNINYKIYAKIIALFDEKKYNNDVTSIVNIKFLI